MKVLTIQEPYATLIMLGYKKIETRSWKTNYRGELYIHAGKSKNFLKMIDDNTRNLIENTSLNFGNIICKADLIDCIEMTSTFIDELKNENVEEFKLGIYQNGRYAWVFDNIMILQEPVSANGKLNVWNYENETNQKKLTLFKK